MKRIFCILALGAIVFASCQREEVFVDRPNEVKSDVLVVDTKTRSYDEALAIAEDALKLLEGDETRSTNKRVIKRSEGQTVMRPVTRGSETEEEPIMYVFNNEDNQGFTVVAADRSKDPLIAVTELGNYTYGTPTGVEPFDLMMEDVATTLSFNPPTPIVPDTPLTPTPGCYFDTICYETVRVDPLLSTKWGQSGIYGAYCSNGLSGCGVTAAVQIMAYHRKPTAMQMTYDNNLLMPLDWRGLLLHTQGASDQTSCSCGCRYDLIGMVMREVGERSLAQYREDKPETSKNERGTGTNPVNVYDALVELGYVRAQHDYYIEIDAYKDAVIDNIDRGLPIFMAGYLETSGGHAWVIDGYNKKNYRIDFYVTNPNYNPHVVVNPEPQYIYDSSEYVQKISLHINWGWNGNCDGWFNLGNFAINEAESYDDLDANNSESYDFVRNFHLIYNIKTN